MQNATRNSPANSNFDNIINTWKPKLNRGVSDFDTHHLITTDWVYLMPFGRGRQVLGNANTFLDTFIGGWQWSGIHRWSSGLPFSLFEPGWTTDWQIESFGVNVGNVKTHKHIDANGNPQYFDNPDAINTGTSSGGPIRLPIRAKPVNATTSVAMGTSTSIPASPRTGSCASTEP